MEAMRDKWTDERLDDMNERISEGFARLDHELRDVRGEIRDLRSDMGGEFAATRTEMGANHRIMLQFSMGTIATMAIGFMGIIVTQL
jgi:hypothetical protein